MNLPVCIGWSVVNAIKDLLCFSKLPQADYIMSELVIMALEEDLQLFRPRG